MANTQETTRLVNAKVADKSTTSSRASELKNRDLVNPAAPIPNDDHSYNPQEVSRAISNRYPTSKYIGAVRHSPIKTYNQYFFG